MFLSYMFMMLVSLSAAVPLEKRVDTADINSESRKAVEIVLSKVLDELENVKVAEKKNEEQIRQLKDEHERNKAEIETLRGLINTTQQAAGTVAFLALMDGGLNYPASGEVIPFTRVITNVGLRYNPFTSTFTCPQHGLYVFSYSIYSGCSASSDRVSGSLMVDDVQITEAFGFEDAASMCDQSSSTAVVECPAGGQVWIECQESGTDLRGDVSDPRTSFTGYVLTYLNHPLN